MLKNSKYKKLPCIYPNIANSQKVRMYHEAAKTGSFISAQATMDDAASTLLRVIAERTQLHHLAIVDSIVA